MTGWGLYRLRDLIGSDDIQTSLPDGRWVRAVPEPYTGNVVKTAWAVLTGKAFAVAWPTPEELDHVVKTLQKSA